MRRILLFAGIAGCLAGCVSVDSDAQRARNALLAGNPAETVRWSEELATDSVYSKNLGLVEAGRASLAAGDMSRAEMWFRRAVDSAVDRKESSPTIKLSDVGNTVLASTVTDDRTREYYLEPYEINLALEYGILAQLANGKREDALADARLSVYIQDNLATTYGADVQKGPVGDAKAQSAGTRAAESQSAALQEMMASTRNSWENPVLWWLTGVLFEADGDRESAALSYRKAAACRLDNPVFVADAARLDGGKAMTPVAGLAKLVVIYEEGLVPQRESLKIPVPIYTGMAIDIPMYGDKTAYRPSSVSISAVSNLVAASPALDIRALAARDLSERLPGVIVRNITRAAVQAGAQTAVNCAGNDYAKIAMFAANAVISAIRRADTRSWVTLPDGQQVWEEGAMKPGNYQIGINVNGRTVATPVSLAAGETKLLWVRDSGRTFQTAILKLN